MTTNSPSAFSFESGNEENSGQPQSSTSETTPGKQVEVKWKVVAKTAGITNASIVGGRLQSEGIPVRVWQESAGQSFGLTIGLLGTGYVAVPSEYETQALEILEIDESDYFEENEE